MLGLKRIRSQRGDTIMEVMIAVAVLSFILTASFVVSNKSSQATRQSVERSEAFKHSETKLEQLKTFISQSATPALPADGTSFCIKNDGTPTPAIVGDAKNFATYDSNPALSDCKQDNRYYSYVQRTGNTFTVYTRWEAATGNGIDESSMVHRIYPDLASQNPNQGTVTVGCAAGSGSMNPPGAYFNAVGGCVPCPAGYYSPGGYFPGPCTPIPPKVYLSMQVLNLDPGNVKKSCSSTSYGSLAGIATRLSGGGNFTASTGTDSRALFDNLAVNTTYNASYTMPAGYESCGATTTSVTTRGLDTQENIALKIRKQAQPTVVVNVKKIRPAAGNNTPDCSSGDRENRSGINTQLYRAGYNTSKTTDGSSNATYNDLQPSVPYTATASAPAGHQLCGASSVTTGGYDSITTVNLAVRPVCYTTHHYDWQQEPVPESYYADHVGWNSYWIKGARRGDKDGYYGNSLGTGEGVYVVGGQYTWLVFYGVSNIYPGYNWYNAWDAVWHSDPVYGAPYYHQYRWVDRGYDYNVCPS